jgi:drug/metabolite transporter (DMT)-like permease
MNKFKYVSLVVFTTLLMGIAFPIGKIGLAYAPPFLFMGIRFVLAGGLLDSSSVGNPNLEGGGSGCRQLQSDCSNPRE